MKSASFTFDLIFHSVANMRIQHFCVRAPVGKVPALLVNYRTAETRLLNERMLSREVSSCIKRASVVTPRGTWRADSKARVITRSARGHAVDTARP